MHIHEPHHTHHFKSKLERNLRFYTHNRKQTRTGTAKVGISPPDRGYTLNRIEYLYIRESCMIRRKTEKQTIPPQSARPIGEEGGRGHKERHEMLLCSPSRTVVVLVHWSYAHTPVSAILAQQSKAQHSGGGRCPHRCGRGVYFGCDPSRADACRWKRAPHPVRGNGGF